MPTQQHVAMLTLAPPEKAAGLLLAMPADRVVVLLGSMKPYDLARILASADVRQKAALVALLQVGRVVPVLNAMSVDEAISLLATLPPERALAIVDVMPSTWVTTMFAAMPTVLRDALLDAMRPSRAALTNAMVYETRVAQSLARTAARVTPMTGEARSSFLVKTCGRALVLAVRYLSGGLLTLRDLLAAQTVTYRVSTHGTLVVTNAALSDEVIRQGVEARRRDVPVEAMTWHGERDDGILARAVIRLAR